jgi:CBS domain containing-hemolysin-like protein
LDDERETSDTLSGLVFTMAGRIPARGEVFTHSTGMVFEVLDADPRRINLLRIRNIPSLPPPV